MPPGALFRSGQVQACALRVLEQELVDASGATTNAHTYVTYIDECTFDQALPNESFLSFGICQTHVLFDVFLFDKLHTSFEIVDTSLELVQFATELFEKSSKFFQIGLVGFLG